MGRKKSEGTQGPKMLRVHAAARELGLHPLTVRRWIKQGKIQAFRVGLESRIPRAEIERFLGKSRTSASPSADFARYRQWDLYDTETASAPTSTRGQR